jgi:electron transfer flavoprotein-quinone oxidoreductase
MPHRKFDVIVVGAGLSGLTASIALAKAGLHVAVLERGAYPGSKNVMGGIFYRHPLDTLLPDFWRTAPVERLIVEQRLWMLGAQGHVGGGMRSERFSKERPNGWTVHRAKFDSWLAEQAEAAGVLLLNGTKVESLLMKKGKVTGVHTLLKDGDMSADVVVIAEGVNSSLLRDLGIHPKLTARQTATVVKEVITLPEGTIEERFNVEKGQGVSIEIFGTPTRGGVGMGFLYTNKNSLSLGIGVLTSDLASLKLKPNDLLEDLKEHPSIKPLIAGGRTEEYLAHLIPEGGYDSVPRRIHGHGWVAIGDTLLLVNSVHREGSNLAVKSGLLAAEAVIAAKKKNDPSARGLSSYRQKIYQSFVIKDLSRYKRLNRFIERNKKLFTVYPDLINDAATEMFTADGVPKREKQRNILKMIRERRGLLGMCKDIFKGVMTLR